MIKRKAFQPVLHPVFIVLMTLYLLHLVLKANQLYQPALISSYFADLICVPFVMSLSLVLLRLLKQDDNLQLSIAKIVFFVVYVSLVFEWLLPMYSDRYTSDVGDVVAYAIGAILYYLFQKKYL